MTARRRLEEADLRGKAVLARGDLDVEDGDNPRIESVRKLVLLLKEKGCARIKVIGHRETKYEAARALREEFAGVEIDDCLRQDPGEKQNDAEFAKRLAEGWEVYVNEAFATSHRRHASIVALPELFREKYLGPRFEREVEVLERIREELLRKKKRAVLVIGGVKVEDKARFANEMGGYFAAVLKGGLLEGVERRADGLDISEESIERYKQEIAKAELIVAAGVMGKYEEAGASRGTEEVLRAIAGNGSAYKLAGGGDIETAIGRYGLADKFDWISVGGGAMLEYLRTGSLAGEEAVRGVV